LPFERYIYRAGQIGQPRIGIRNVDTERTSAAFHEHLQIAPRLSRFHQTEAVGMARRRSTKANSFSHPNLAGSPARAFDGVDHSWRLVMAAAPESAQTGKP